MMTRFAILSVCAALLTSGANADTVEDRAKIEDLFARATAEQNFFMTCLNAMPTERKFIQKSWLSRIKDATQQLEKHPDRFDPVFVNTLRLKATQADEIDDSMTLGEQRKLCGQDKDWMKKIQMFDIVRLEQETSKIIDGD